MTYYWPDWIKMEDEVDGKLILRCLRCGKHEDIGPGSGFLKRSRPFIEAHRGCKRSDA